MTNNKFINICMAVFSCISACYFSYKLYVHFTEKTEKAINQPTDQPLENYKIEIADNKSVKIDIIENELKKVKDPLLFIKRTFNLSPTIFLGDKSNYFVVVIDRITEEDYPILNVGTYDKLKTVVKIRLKNLDWFSEQIKKELEKTSK